MADTTARGFDPARFLTKVSGNDYLEVKWRLLWLRSVHPDASIVTEMVKVDDSIAIFRAEVTLPSGGSATGWGQEQYGDFRDYIEKAETKALGRALAALGFGTQFCRDYDFGGDQNRVVDAPVKLQPQPHRQQGPTQQQGTTSEQPATTRQHGFIEALSRELGISDDALKSEVEASYGCAVTGLNRRDASVLIERLQQRRATAPTAAPN